VVFQQTKAITTALADFLDGLDHELANEGSGASQARLSPDQVRAFLLDVEPPPQDGGQGGFHPRAPRRGGALGRLPGFYGYHVALNNGLYQRLIPRSFAWRQSVELWKTLTYLGGTHAASGLLSDSRRWRRSNTSVTKLEERRAQSFGSSLFKIVTPLDVPLPSSASLSSFLSSASYLTSRRSRPTGSARCPPPSTCCSSRASRSRTKSRDLLNDRVKL